MLFPSEVPVMPALLKGQKRLQFVIILYNLTYLALIQMVKTIECKKQKKETGLSFLSLDQNA